MIDFEISQDDLAKVSRLMTKARTGATDELVELTCYTGNVRFIVTGREFTCPASVNLKGLAQFPLALLPRLRKAASTFQDNALRIRIENGKVRVNSMTLSLPAIVVRRMTDRPIDIPDDAPDRDILALRYIFTEQEVAESDLANRYSAANSKKIKTLASAVRDLSLYGVPAHTLEILVNDALKRHAETLRPMLKPTLATERVN